jgi:KaiC/GvpD/RAD55 family RecA-like ATPase
VIDIDQHYSALAQASRTLQPLAVRPFADLYHDQTLNRPIAWAIDGLVPAARLTMVYGAPKAGKTTLTYAMVAAIVTGQPFGGRRTRQGRVLVIEAEMHEQDTRSYLVGAGLTPERVEDRLFTYTGPAPDFDQLVHAVEVTRCDTVLIDSASKVFKWEDENSAAEAERKMEPYRRLAHERNISVLLIDHDRKSEGEHARNIRGSGHKLSVVDVALEVRRTGRGSTARELRVTGRHGDAVHTVVRHPDGTYVDGAAAEVHPDDLFLVVACQRTQWRAGDLVGLDRQQRRRTTLLPVLTNLVARGFLERLGGGTKRDPYRF